MKFLLILWLVWPFWAGAEIYQWQDGLGNRHFSDRSFPDAAEIVAIKPGYSFYRVKKVFDGDTVVLEDGRKVRLLGINTPEVRHRNEEAQAGGDEAKRWLVDRLQNSKVRLETDTEKTDKYARTLAHLFTEDNAHINLQLVAAGLATVSIYPPNLLYVKDLIEAQDQVEQARLGIWQRAEYAVVPVSSLADQRHAGWMRLVGKIINIRSSRKYSYLAFSDQFEARIERKWLSLFPDMNSYLGQTVEIRGWLNKNRNGFSMLIRHPSAIKRR